MAKLGSRFEWHLLRSGGLAVLLWLAAGRLVSGPVTAEFTSGVADARSFAPLRLAVDLGGRERKVHLELNLPPGCRIAPGLEAFTAGGRRHVQILNIYVPERAVAGAFTVQGTVIDGTRRWPFVAAIRVRSSPRLLVQDEDVGFSTVRSEEPVSRTWRATNNGNVILDLRASAMPTTGAVLSVEPASFRLAPGEQREVTLTARLANAPDRLVTLLLFLNLDSGKGLDRRRETVGFTAEFIPLEAGTGPLFAELDGEVLAGGVINQGHSSMAGRIRLEGEVWTGVKLLAYGTDGTAAPGGSHLGLATRDFLTVELSNKHWHATGGLVSPPVFGFLENSTQGRGGTLAWSGGSGLIVTALGAREQFGDFEREHAGLHAAQMDPDGTGWQAGVLAQRNQSGTAPKQERVGGFAQTNWQWLRLVGLSQVAIAQDPDSREARFGLEQRLDYRTEDDRSSAAIFVQTAPAGFFLNGRSLELRDASVVIATGESGWINLRASESREVGLLRSYRQTEVEAGELPTDPTVVELITRTGSAVRTWSAGYGAILFEGRAQVTLSNTDRTRDATEAQPTSESYRERALTADWSKSFREGRLFATVTAASGSEENWMQHADFAEAAFTCGGLLRDDLQFMTELRHTWHTGGSRNTGYRQPGTYGRGSFIWTLRPRWRLEAGLDGYQFSDYPSRLRSFAVLEVPLARHVTFATEISHDDERTSLWLAVRVNFKAQMPWHPIRGAITGRVLGSGNGAPVAGAWLDLGGRPGLTDAAGRFALPSRRPGTYPFSWSLPVEFLAAPDWPRTVEIKAGKLQALELIAERIAVLSGTVEIDRDGVVERPTGSVSATDEAGRIFEAMAAAGDFKLLLPPGRYTIRYTGEVAAELNAKLVAAVEVGPSGEPATVRLFATATVRNIRRTFYEDTETPLAKPAGG